MLNSEAGMEKEALISDNKNTTKESLSQHNIETECCSCDHHKIDMDQSSFTSSYIVLIAKLVIAVVIRFWRACTAGLLILLLIYWLYGSLVALGLLVAAIFGVLYNAQDMLLYHPNQPENSRIYVESPAVMGLPFENTFIATKDGERINLLIIKQTPEKLHQAPTFVFFHGNAGNVGHRLFNAYSLFTYCQANVVLVEYRGFGKSSGRPSESGLYYDAEVAVDYVFKRADFNQQKIFLFGRSLGGAVALYVAALPFNTSRVAGVIIENTFLSIPAIGYHIFQLKLLKVLPEIFYKNKYPSQRSIRKVQAPTLFLSGLADTLIPPRMMNSLYAASGSAMKRMARFEGGTHNETWQCNGYYQAILRFTKEAEEFRKQGHSHSHESATDAYSTQVPFNNEGRGTQFTL